MSDTIQIFSLTKRYPSGRERFHTVLNDIHLNIREGELFGLLGPNGAGKTTLIKILSTLILPSSGRAFVNGYDLSDEQGVKRSIGLSTGDERGFYWRLSGRRNLEFFSALHGISRDRAQERINRVLDVTDLQGAAGTPFSDYSSGMKQRLCIGRALLHEPRILFLDEPTRGLDPKASRELRTFIRDELTRRSGVTVFLTTHLLEEAEEICDRVAVMVQGEIKGCGTIEELKRGLGFSERYSVLVEGDSPELCRALRTEMPRVRATVEGAKGILLEFEPADGEDLGRIIDFVRSGRGKILQLQRHQPSLWSVFSALTEETERTSGWFGSPQVPLHDPGAAKRGEPKASAEAESCRSDLFPPLRDALRAAWAFVKRDFLLETSYRLAFCLHLLGILFSVAMFYFISRLFGAAAAPYLASYGSDYFSFVLIGIAFYAYSNVGLTSFSSNLREAQTTGTLESVLGTPTGIGVTVLSLSIWSFILTTFDVLVYLLAGGAIAEKGLNANYLSALLTLALTVAAMSSLGVAAGSFVLIFKRGNPVLLVFSNLAGLLSGVYYPVEVLPRWLQSVAEWIPITHSLEAMRRSLLQGASVGEVLPELLFLLLFALAFLPLGLLLLRHAYNRARQDGSLTHY